MMRSVERLELERYEGLVKTTARMWGPQVRREEDDLAQELRVIVWRAVGGYDESRGLPLDNHVFQCVTNKIKDYKRDARRERDRQERHGVSFVHTEDMVFGCGDDTLAKQERLEALFHNIDRDEVYAKIDDRFALPAGVTERECDVLMCLTLGMSKREIVVRLSLRMNEIDRSIRGLKDKLADWRPTGNRALQSNVSSALSTAHAVEAGDRVVGSRAA